MNKITIQPVTEETLEALLWALAQLAHDMGDAYSVEIDRLHAACLGDQAPCRGLMATRGVDVIGAVLLSPVFSTTYGAAGVYVSDLWVAETARGTGLGRALLAAAARAGQGSWQAAFLKLTVYDENVAAAQFYDRLGFETAERDRTCLLSGQAYDALLQSAG